MISQTRSAIIKKLTKLSGKICIDCPVKHKCNKETDCEKHKLVNEIIELLE